MYELIPHPIFASARSLPKRRLTVLYWYCKQASFRMDDASYSTVICSFFSGNHPWSPELAFEGPTGIQQQHWRRQSQHERLSRIHEGHTKKKRRRVRLNATPRKHPILEESLRHVIIFSTLLAVVFSFLPIRNFWESIINVWDFSHNQSSTTFKKVGITGVVSGSWFSEPFFACEAFWTEYKVHSLLIGSTILGLRRIHLQSNMQVK